MGSASRHTKIRRLDRRLLALSSTLALTTSVLVSALCSIESASAAEVVRLGDSKLILTWQDEFKDREQQKIREWLTYSATSASLIGGFFPHPTAKITIHKLTKGKGPVPWAHTVRQKDKEGVVFHVNPRKSLKTFKRDWTATHEFSHLYLPYVGRQDIWISEGFASYYQYILMMRNGTLSQLEGWQKLKDGFDRGAADRNQAATLEAASRNMRQMGAFKRVYWSGALYFFEIDLELRKRGTSLDQAIIAFHHCCKNKEISWSGMTLAEQLDYAAKTRIFSQKYREFESTEGFPSFDQQLATVGVVFDGKRIRFNDDPQASQRRAAISGLIQDP